MAKKEILQNVGEVSPSLQPPAAFSATPSSGGHPRNAPVDTPIEAPYVLPEGWKWERLGNYISLLRGVSYKKEAAHSEKLKNDCLIMRGGNIVEGSINLESDNIYVDKSLVSENQLIKKNDIIIVTSTGSTKVIGRAGVSKDNYTDVAFGAFLTLARPNDLANKSYINHYFQSSLYRGRIRQLASGVNINNIRTDYITETPISLPPTFAEQQRIVNRIETMFAKLDQAQKKAQSVLDSFETRKAAILHKAFSGQLRIDNEELTIADWEDTTIGECCKLGSGGTPLKSHPEYYENGNIPWLKTGEIDWNDIYDVEEKITNAGVENSSAKIFPAESVVVAMYGMGVTRGKAAIIKIPTTTNQAVCVLQPNEKLNNRFLFYYFMCNYWQIRERSVGGNQLNLSGKIIASFPIKLPPLNYQLSIVNFLNTVLEKESRAKEAAQTVLDQIALLKKSILARAFRGEL